MRPRRRRRRPAAAAPLITAAGKPARNPQGVFGSNPTVVVVFFPVKVEETF